MTRHRFETASVVALLLLVLGVAFLAMDATGDPSGRVTVVVAFLGIAGWVVYERYFVQ